MPTARELLDQADALMRRNRADALDDIPVLTEVMPAVAFTTAPQRAPPPVDPGPPSVPLLTENIEVIDEDATPGVEAVEGEPSAWLEFDDANPSVIGDAPDSIAIVPSVDMRTPPPDEALLASAEHEEIEFTLPADDGAAAEVIDDVAAAVAADDLDDGNEEAFAVESVGAFEAQPAAAIEADADAVLGADFGAVDEPDAHAPDEVEFHAADVASFDRADDVDAHAPDNAAIHAADVASFDRADDVDAHAPDNADVHAAAVASLDRADEADAGAPILIPADAVPVAAPPAVLPPQAVPPLPIVAADLAALVSAVPAAAAAVAPATPPAAPAMADDDERWVAAAEEIRMQVLQRIDLFTDTGLRDQLTQRLQPIADRASADFVKAINLHVGDLLRTYVAEAIEREIERWRRDH